MYSVRLRKLTLVAVVAGFPKLARGRRRRASLGSTGGGFSGAIIAESGQLADEPNGVSLKEIN
jgi:hypothetical protein